MSRNIQCEFPVRLGAGVIPAAVLKKMPKGPGYASIDMFSIREGVRGRQEVSLTLSEQPRLASGGDNFGEVVFR